MMFYYVDITGDLKDENNLNEISDFLNKKRKFITDQLGPLSHLLVITIPIWTGNGDKLEYIKL